jgi:hypothetical protein
MGSAAPARSLAFIDFAYPSSKPSPTWLSERVSHLIHGAANELGRPGSPESRTTIST